jgi:hypothetical protein
LSRYCICGVVGWPWLRLYGRSTVDLHVDEKGGYAFLHPKISSHISIFLSKSL